MDRIARVSTSGRVKEFQIIVPHGQPAMMTLGADGSVWFTQPQAGKIGRITPDGYVTEFPLPAAGVPLGIASGVDKNLWVTVIRAQVIYRLTPGGEFAAFPMPANSMATFITAAPDGTLWFTEPNGKVGRLTTDGYVKQFVFSNPYSEHVGK